MRAAVANAVGIHIASASQSAKSRGPVFIGVDDRAPGVVDRHLDVEPDGIVRSLDGLIQPRRLLDHRADQFAGQRLRFIGRKLLVRNYIAERCGHDFDLPIADAPTGGHRRTRYLFGAHGVHVASLGEGQKILDGAPDTFGAHRRCAVRQRRGLRAWDGFLHFPSFGLLHRSP
ncbi:hypothetical protein WL26_03850 [Burkholderia cepacia]|nr:hypothetical protein WL26_03850 [Burkholderia cepacia]